MSFIYNFIFVYILISSFLEMYSNFKVNKFWFYSIVIIMWLTAGLAYGISPDGVAYWNAFEGSYIIPFTDLTHFAYWSGMEIGYIYVNKFISSFGVGYGTFTLIFTGIMLYLKSTTMYKYGGYVFLALLLYYIPSYFFEENIHVRQGMANAITLFSIRYIIKRNFYKFLLCLIIAFLFHKACIIFIFAYWVVKFRLNIPWIVTLVLIAVIANYTGLTKSIDAVMQLMPFGIDDSFNNYSDSLMGGSKIDTTLGDIVKLLTVGAILIFNKQASENDEYFPYFRNLYLTGVLLYFFFGSGIFAARLPGFYLIYISFLVPTMIKGLVNNPVSKNVIYIAFIMYIFLLYMRFASIQGGENSGFGNYRTIFSSGAAYGLTR